MGHHVVEVEIVRRRCNVSENSAHVHDTIDGVDGIPTCEVQIMYVRLYNELWNKGYSVVIVCACMNSCSQSG